MSEAKISIRAGSLEIEYTGDSAFLASGLLDLIKQISDIKPLFAAAKPLGADGTDKEKEQSAQTGSLKNLSTDTIATLLGVKTGPDLIVAAAAHLTLSQGKEKFTRAEILTEMKTAPGFYKETYRSNLGQSLTSVTGKDRLRLIGGDTYALSNKEKMELEAKLAEKP